LYPIFLFLRDRRVVVAGAGRVALRKVRGLLDAGARVTVIAPEVLPEFEKLSVTLVRRKARARDLDGAFLAFAATDDRRANHALARAARKRGILANIADSPAECDFLTPARATRGNLQIAVSTGGESPRLAAELRRKLESMLDAAATGKRVSDDR
jgi:siroheme synthase-like protein